MCWLDLEIRDQYQKSIKSNARLNCSVKLSLKMLLHKLNPSSRQRTMHTLMTFCSKLWNRLYTKLETMNQMVNKGSYNHLLHSYTWFQFIRFTLFIIWFMPWYCNKDCPSCTIRASFTNPISNPNRTSVINNKRSMTF